MEVFLGVPAVDGSGIGTAFVIPEPVKRAIPQHRIKIDELNEGWERFEIAVQTVTLQLSEHLDSLSKTSNKDKAQREVFETYILMLGDPVFNKEVKENILYLDGGTGTLLQKAGLIPGELPERWNITHPNIIAKIHKSYYDAGSNVVNTNTFGANVLKFSNEELEEIISAAVKNARRAGGESIGAQPRWVALDIGPTGRMLKPYGDLDFEDAVGEDLPDRRHAPPDDVLAHQHAEHRRFRRIFRFRIGKVQAGSCGAGHKLQLAPALRTL